MARNGWLQLPNPFHRVSLGQCRVGHVTGVPTRSSNGAMKLCACTMGPGDPIGDVHGTLVQQRVRDEVSGICTPGCRNQAKLTVCHC
eukprot:scaffold1771_cov343-Pavlova_lutheri.AAC.24